MNIGMVTKRPAEKLYVYADFVDAIGSENTATLVSVVASNSVTGVATTSEVIASSPAASITGYKVKWLCIDGSAGGQHKMTVTVDSSTGETFQADVDLRII